MEEKRGFLKKYRAERCLNCETPLDKSDHYCHYCGQKNLTKRVSLKDFFNEFFASIISYDSRLRQSMNALLFRPGKISKDYIEGKRARYVNPFRFYLSVSIIYFLLNSLFLDYGELQSSFKGDTPKENIHIKFNDNSSGNKKPLILIDSLPDANTKNDSTKTVLYSSKQLDSIGFFNAISYRWDMYRYYYNETKQTSPYVALGKLNHENTWINRKLYERTTKFDNINESASDLIKFILNKLPLIIFFFLPIFALSIWLLYLRRNFNYMEHLIFIFHVQTLFFIVMGIALLIEQLTDSPVPSSIVQLIFLVYLYKAMRHFYQQNRGKTIVKFLLVNLLFIILATIGSIITITVSAIVF